MYGWSWILDLSCKNLKPESDSGVVPKTKKKNRLSDESKTTLANLKVHYDDQTSVLNQEKSALKEAVTIAKAETEEKCKLLDESQTQLANLKVHYDDQISVLDQEKSALKEAVTIAKAETEEKCKLLDESQTQLANLKVHYDDQISVLNQQKKEADNIILELQRQLNSGKDDLKTLKQSAASARQQAEALAIEQSAALTEALGTLQQAVRHAKEEPPSGPDAEEEPVGISETLGEWLDKHGFTTRVPPKTWIQLLEHSGFLIEEKVSHLREKANSLFHDNSETDDHASSQN